MPAEMTNRQVHAIVREQLTAPYIRRAHIGAFAYPAHYAPWSPLSDYDKTSFTARPRPWSEWAGRKILGPLHSMNGDDIDKLYMDPLKERTAELEDTLPKSSVMLVNGHQTYDLQAAMSLVMTAAAIGAAQPGRRSKNVGEMFKISHGVATRGIVPIAIGPRLPILRFANVARLAVNPHFSFPRNARMMEAGLAEGFLADYNSRLRQDCITVANNPTQHPSGFKTLWSMSPSGTPDITVKEGKRTGEKMIPRINSASIDLIKQMGCTLLPIHASFKKDNGNETVVDFQNLVPAGAVNADAIHGIMTSMAEMRRQQGERVYYELEAS